MFDAAVCYRMRLAPKPAVSGEAFLALKGILSCVSREGDEGVVEAQHRSLLCTGGADAKLTKFPADGATEAVSPARPGSFLGEVSARDTRADRGSSGAPAAGALRAGPRLQAGKGGEG